MRATTQQLEENPYAVLGVGRTATNEEIKQAYFAQVRQHPPEREPAAFKRIRAAYDRLRTPERRVEADLQQFEPWPAPARARKPRLDLAIHPEHVLAVAAAGSDLERTDFRGDYREVRL